MYERILWTVVRTHLVHITGPFHDVLEGAFTRDVVHQEDSLDGERGLYRERVALGCVAQSVSAVQLQTEQHAYVPPPDLPVLVCSTV